MTIAVIALIGGAALDRTVAAACATGAPVVISHGNGRITDPAGRTLRTSGEVSVPMRRQIAADLASDEYVAFLEDTVLPVDGWLSALEDAFRRPGIAAVGGPVEVDRKLPPRCRALGWTEYGRFQSHSGNPAVSVTTLPGCNFAFRTAELREMLGNTKGGLVDQEIFAAITAKGRSLSFARDMRVTYLATHETGIQLRNRFAHGRIYAARTRDRAGKPLTAFKAVLSPPVLFARQLTQMLSTGSLDLAALPWMAVMNGAWGVGELTGALLGLGRNGLGDWN